MEQKGKADEKARNLRTSVLMKRLFTALAIGMLALGGRHCYNHLKSKKKGKLQKVKAAKLEVWEGEGGAVPVAPHRTAAQIAPQNRAPASPRADN